MNTPAAMNPHRTPPLPPQQRNGPTPPVIGDQMLSMGGGGGSLHPISTTNAPGAVSPYYSSGTTMCQTSHPAHGPGGMTVVSPVIGGATARACAGCGTKIVERFLLLALDRYWHTGCLKCSCCQATLADIGSSCYTRSGMILCRQDYFR